VTKLFDRVVACGEPGGPNKLKPAPDGFLLAAKVLGVEPNRCLVIGDRTDADGAAAKASGMEFRLIT
jgi:HAD superfamily hydrolase (TIGR01509 family)